MIQKDLQAASAKECQKQPNKQKVFQECKTERAGPGAWTVGLKTTSYRWRLKLELQAEVRG